jgi:hypothetical protein
MTARDKHRHKPRADVTGGSDYGCLHRIWFLKIWCEGFPSKGGAEILMDKLSAKCILRETFPGDTMRNFGAGANTAVFLIFFGIALLDAISSRNFLRSAFWVGIGLLFLAGDLLKPRNRS